MADSAVPNGDAYALRRESRTTVAPEQAAVRWRRRLLVWGAVLLSLAMLVGGWMVWHSLVHVATLSARVRATVLELSPRVDARLAEVLVKERQTVRRGEVLARLDDSELRHALDGALAEENIRQSAFHQARARERLTTAQVAADIAMAEAQLAVAQAQRESLRAQLVAQRQRLPEQILQAEAVLARRQAEFDLLVAGPRSEDAESAKVRVASARETLGLYELEVRQSRELVGVGIDSQHILEVRKTRLETQKLALREAELALAKLEAGPRTEEIQAARKGLEAEETNVRLVRLGEVELERLEKELLIREAAVAEAEARLGQARARQEEAAIMAQQVAVAEAELAKATSTVAGRRAALDDMVVVSPVDGVITRVFVKVGELCTRGTPILLVTDDSDPRWIEAYVDEEDAQLLSPGQSAQVYVPANSRDQVSAKIIQLGLHTQTLDGGGGSTQFGQPDRVWVKLLPDDPLPERIVTGTTARGLIRVR